MNAVKKISAQNIMPGMCFNHPWYGKLEVVEREDDHKEGVLKISILANRNGRFVYEPYRMLEVV